MELYQGYDPRYRSTIKEFIFSAHVYLSDVDTDLTVIFWEIDKNFLVIEKLSYDNFTKLTDEG
jgi:hypothetical protein